MKATYAILAAAIAQEATATWNLFAKPLTSPNYNNNECSDKQKAGFDWSDLQDGASNFQYGDFDFSAGWKCSSAKGKRDALTKRTFGQKTINNKCSKQKPATFGCNKRTNGFSITTIDISVEFDVEIDLHYEMNDGKICKQKSVPCKKDGNTIENTQCGGAKSVQVYLGSRYQGQKSECQIGLHHIGFDCNPGKEYKPPTPPSPPPPPPPVKSSAPPPPPVVSSAPPPPVVSYTPGPPPGISSVPEPPVQSSVVHSFSSLAPYMNSSAPVHGPTPPVMPPTYETPSIPSPPQDTPLPPSPPSLPSSHVTPPSYPTNPASPPAMPSSPAPPSPPSKGEDVPPQLPSCMNTWLQISTEDCKDNTATDCYCKNSKFTKNVIECVQAWCETDEQTKQALQYLVGICASHVPENPGIVSDCPKDTFEPAPPSQSPPPAGNNNNNNGGSYSAIPGPPKPSAPPVQGNTPVTTIVYSSTTVTVPMVHFSTQTPVAGGPAPTAPVGLVGGSAPPSTPAGTTPAPYPLPSTLRPTTVRPTGTGAVRPSSPAEFTGAASPRSVEVKHALFGGVMAFAYLAL